MYIPNNPVKEYEMEEAMESLDAKALQAANPHLIPVSDKNGSLVAAAKNIRIELARAFPSVKFAVRSSRFSMGNLIRVSWTDGPTSSQVDLITDKYSAGSFDGMTDCYNYDTSAWNDAFGSAKFVHSYRDHSDRFIASVLSRVAKYRGAETPTVADYKSGSLWKVKANCQDFSREVHTAMSRHTCAIAR